MNWLTKLERKYGRICIPNLISILVEMRFGMQMRPC